MNICFVLPQMLRKPMGGYKIVYEYSNRLVRKGINVDILFLNEKALERFNLPKHIRTIAVHLFTKRGPQWFELDKNVNLISSTDIHDLKRLKDYDCVIATGADTILQVHTMFPNCRKAYFIQGYETWVLPEEELRRTYALGQENVVISKWLKDIVDSSSVRSSYLISNPIDTKKYRVLNKPDMRNKYCVGILYHGAEQKGFAYGYEVLKKLKTRYPDLKVLMFGTSKPDFDIPEWVSFYIKASQDKTVEIYNEISCFICPTISEGFGLTGLEAMACGAVLISTDYEGVKEYAINGKNSLLSPVKNVEQQYDNVCKVIDNDDLRFELAQNGVLSAKTNGWDTAVDSFEKFLRNEELVK